MGKSSDGGSEDLEGSRSTVLRMADGTNLGTCALINNSGWESRRCEGCLGSEFFAVSSWQASTERFHHDLQLMRVGTKVGWALTLRSRQTRT